MRLTIIDYIIIHLSGQFDRNYYLFTYPDVRQADIDPLWHYVKYGWKEGRKPSEKFDINFSSTQLDHSQGGGQNPLVRYLLNSGNGDSVSNVKETDAGLRKVKSSNAVATPLNLSKAKEYYEKNGFWALVKKTIRKFSKEHNIPRHVESLPIHPGGNNSEKADIYQLAYDQAMNHASGKINKLYEKPSSSSSDKLDDKQAVKLVAFYLPQYYPFPENDKWWGKGFTEWTNVTKAVPQFVGHYQPRFPGPLGYYDLRISEVQEQQAAIAKEYGIFGFCFYYYWFSGRRLLQTPLDNYINNRKITFPYCICWANENWTRRWDGLESEVLISQEHTYENDHRFIHDVVDIFRDKRYIQYDKRPVLIVYRPTLMAEPQRTFDYWRNYVVKQGLNNPFIISARTFGFEKPESIGLDASVDFPPHNFSYTPITQTVQLLNRQYRGEVYDYREMVRNNISLTADPLPRIRTIVPSWDNEARKPGRGDSFIHSHPKLYQRWLEQVSFNAIISSEPNKRFVFINAWNEWAEGAHLEPDREYGFAYLQATRRALESVERKRFLLKNNSLVVNPKKNHDTAVILHVHYPEMLEEIFAKLSNIRSGFDLFVTTSLNTSDVSGIIFNTYPEARILSLMNKGRDIGSFIELYRMIYHHNYKYLLKIHTKKSPHRVDGDIWRHDMLSKLLSRDAVKKAQTVLDKQPNVGIIGPQGHVVINSYYWGSNREKTLYLAKKLGLVDPEKHPFSFVAGSMFWTRPEVMKFLLTLPINITDFEEEPLPPDGALAHAIERLICLVSTVERQAVVGISEDGKIDHGSQNPDYEFADSTAG